LNKRLLRLAFPIRHLSLFACCARRRSTRLSRFKSIAGRAHSPSPSSPHMSFAETANLRIRGYRDSDLDKVVALLHDVRTQRGDPGYVVPTSETKGKKTVEDFLPKLLMFCVLEAKAPLNDESHWVGIMTFANKGSPKNRNAMFGICLEEKFWGRGLGRPPFLLWYSACSIPCLNSSRSHSLASWSCLRSAGYASRLPWCERGQSSRHRALQEVVRILLRELFPEPHTCSAASSRKDESAGRTSRTASGGT
jgi:hypothetical protein